ncbi:MAG TPA: DUF2510 domain-containing protein, partial [Acidimicrobiales bacterium]|nr:DUF2510 domain-containing protein [Acidimicrobiales bacterium]
MAQGSEPLAGPAVAAGWYADPSGHRPYRWWDGSRWTAYAAGAEVEWDPLAEPLAQEIQPGLPGLGVAFVGFAAAVGLSLLSIAVMRAAGRPGGRPAELLVSQLCLWAPLVAAVVFVSHRRGTGSVVVDYGCRVRLADVGIGLVGSVVARSVSGLVILPVVLAQPTYPHVHSEL